MSLTYQYELKPNSKILVAEISGSLLEKNDANEITSLIEENIEEGNNQVILDLKGLEYMNSTGINILISYLTKLRNSGGELIIVNISDKVEQLLLITKLMTVFTVAASVEEGYNKLMQAQD